MTEIKSFKKYSWLISGIIAIIVGISAISITDLTFLPENLKTYAIAIIGICGILVKIIPENYRVKVAEELIRHENDDKVTVNVDIDDEQLYNKIKQLIEEENKDNMEIEDIDPSSAYQKIGDSDGC